MRRLGYFGSYARGDWGVGSDLDLINTGSYPFAASQARASEQQRDRDVALAQLLFQRQNELVEPLFESKAEANRWS